MDIEEVKRLIVEAQEKSTELEGRLQEAQDLNAVIEANLEAALAELDEEPDEGEGEVDDGYIGGEPGSGDRNVVANQTFTSSPKLQANTDYLDCIFKKPIGGGNKCPDNVRFLSCTFKDIRGDDQGGSSGKCIYFNNGHNENEIGLVFDDCDIDGCEADEFIEAKLSDITFHRCRQKNSKLGKTIKQRFGRKLTVMNCEGFGQIMARGWAHYIDNCPGATVTFWAGNLPAKYEDWEDMHVPEGGNNMEATEISYANGVKKLITGKMSNGSCDQYPCLNCIGGPDIVTVEKAGPTEGFTRGEIDSPEQLWERAGL